MAAESATTGTTDQGTGTGTAPSSTGTGTAQDPATGTAQGQASDDKGKGNGATTPSKPPEGDLAKQLAQAQARIQELEQANLTEAERKDRRLADLEAQQANWEVERQALVLRQAVWQEAVKAGAVYPDLVVNAVDSASVDWAKDGTPSNIAKVVADARQAYPALFRVVPGQADGGAGQGQPSPQPTMNDLIRRSAGRQQ